MSITTQEKLGDNVAASVAAVITADGQNFPFPAFGPRDPVAMDKSRIEIRSGNFIRASDQMARNAAGKWYYCHRRGFVSGTVVSQRQSLTNIGPDSKHAEAIGRFRYLLSITTQLLTPDAISGYQVIDLIDQGDNYTADLTTRIDRTDVRFQIEIWLNPELYVDPTDLNPTVETEEVVYSYTAANNGADPVWCLGSTCLVRSGELVLCSGLETVGGWSPLNNCRWRFYSRPSTGWQLEHTDNAKTREPTPIVLLNDENVFLSANPQSSGDLTTPSLFQFLVSDPSASPTESFPTWDGSPVFTDISYRSFAADGPAGELVILQNVGLLHAEWAFRNSAGAWESAGKLYWPTSADGDNLRLLYSSLALRNKALHFFGGSAIVDPEDPSAFLFQNVFYSWTRNIGNEAFSQWLLVSSRTEDGGYVFPWDIWLAPNGSVYVLWEERVVTGVAATTSYALRFAVIVNGVVTRRANLYESNGTTPVAFSGRFHETPDGRLFVVSYQRVPSLPTGGTNQIVEILSNGSIGESVALPLAKPFNTFFTASKHAGNKPSYTLDMLGKQDPATFEIAYAKIQLFG